MSNRSCNCKCKPLVTVTGATTTETLTTLTIDSILTSLCDFRLCVPCSIISTILDDSTIAFTDGTNTYPGLMGNGNNLRAITLKDNCCCNRCGSFRVDAFVGHDPDHVTVYI